MRWILSAVFLFVATAAQAAPPQPGSLCAAFIQFIEAPAPESRVRTFLFYPADPNATGLVTMDMDATPHDAAADVFAEQVGGRSWQGGFFDFAGVLSDCVPGGFRSGLRFTLSKPLTLGRIAFLFSTRDQLTNRRIEIEADQKVCPEALRTRLTQRDQLCLRVTVKGK